MIKPTAQKLRGKLWVHINGLCHQIELEENKYSAKAKNLQHGGDLLAPMPGKVTKVNKQIGENVEAGDVVLVMEAMKMEYALKSSVAGLVNKINYKVGDQVTLGTVLVEIKEREQK